ncbi:hypothetical protein ACGRHY_29940 [Streptomyces sp. HK10]|uniref:hypothetical protein n=1 Tax=Streptomyces sp. HK10 TaxID=3373255 RepID=UPI0037498267
MSARALRLWQATVGGGFVAVLVLVNRHAYPVWVDLVVYAVAFTMGATLVRAIADNGHRRRDTPG